MERLVKLEMTADQGRDWETILRVVNRGLQASCQRPGCPNRRCNASQPLTQPGTDQLRGLKRGIDVELPFASRVEIPAIRRSTAGIQPVEPLILLAPEDREQVAADPVAGRFGHAQDRVGRDRRIDAIAAGLENIDPGHARRVAGWRRPFPAG